MKKFKNKGLLILSIVLLVFIASTITYRLLQDENKLTITEKNYINNNRSTLIDINILNNINIFGDAGKGVFYDFLSDFITTRDLSFNQIAITTDNTSNGLTLSKGSSIPNNGKIFYTDHFVLVSKSYTIIDPNNLETTVGILLKDETRVRKQISSSIELKTYDKKNALLEGFENGEVEYILVPKIEYLDFILDKLYHIVYHYSDIKDYYYMSASDNDLLTSILGKYYNEWMNTKFEKSFNNNEYQLFTKNLRITEKELDVIDSKEYNYGFINNGPYDNKTNSAYGGITSLYLNNFSKFSGITFNYDKYKNIDKLNKAINNKKVDLYLNYNIDGNYTKIDSLFTVDISFVMANNDDRVFTNMDSVKSYKIYAKSNTKVFDYLKNQGFTVETYNKDSKLNKILNKKGIVAMDYLSYLIYKKDNQNINERFRVNTDITYNFMSNNDTMFNRLLYYYVSSKDKNELIYMGIDSYYRANSTGNLIYNIIKYAILLILIVIVIFYLITKFGKRTFVRKKIKKNDKMKYIDILTSVKNRNFLSENLPIWNQNTIYPQSVIVIDLNGIQELNDSYGYQEGDKQIQALANILIKTQLDNTEIMRTDGNEFTIYMVGYSERQVLSYIKKLTKEFKNLPHDLGAAIGFSMIESDVKLIDDAINEATEKMRENKLLSHGGEDEKGI